MDCLDNGRSGSFVFGFSGSISLLRARFYLLSKNFLSKELPHPMGLKSVDRK